LPGGRSNVCGECRGAGGCRKCDGSGVNLHLNDAEPKCRTCEGTGRCYRCGGTGKRQEEAPVEMPMAVRIIATLWAGFMIYLGLLKRTPMQVARVGPPLPWPVALILSIAAFSLVLLVFWWGVKREDFQFRKNRERISLFGSGKDEGPRT
jgi:nitrogen fixation-related uncharacterized protein